MPTRRRSIASHYIDKKAPGRPALAVLPIDPHQVRHKRNASLGARAARESRAAKRKDGMGTVRRKDRWPPAATWTYMDDMGQRWFRGGENPAAMLSDYERATLRRIVD